MSSLPGVGDRVVGRFELLEAREHCGAYSAFRALDREVEVEVALWAMRRELFLSVEQMDTFVGVAVEMRDLSHRNLLRVFDAGHDGQQVFVTMQLSSESVADRLRRAEKASLAELVEKATSLSDALDMVHSLGYVHGRLAPRSITSVADLTKLSGVGLFAACSAKAVDWSSDVPFMAPEVRRGAAPTAAADVYSLAALMLCMATGASELEQAIAAAGEGPLLDSLRPALADLPASRPRTAGALALAFKQSVVDDKVPTTQRPAQPVSPNAATLIDAEPSAVGGDTEELEQYPPTVIDNPVTPPPAERPASEVEFRASTAEETADESLDNDETNHYLRIDEGLVAASDPDFDHVDATLTDATPVAGLANPEVPPFFQDGLGRPDAIAPDAAGPEPAPGPSPEQTEPPQQTGPVAPASGTGSGPRFVSMKPEETGRMRTGSTPLLPPTDRPDLRQPTGSGRPPSAESPSTGERLAPPREGGGTRRAGGTPFVLISVVVLVAAAAVVAALLLFRGSDEEPDSTAVAAADAAPESSAEPDAGSAGPTGPCPEAMVLVAGYCIDAHEWPGEGRLPETGVTTETAAAACAARSARLCSPEEWENACRANGSASWPYGDAYRADICNVRTGEVAPAGSRDRCQTSAGVYDLAGNVAEWDASGQIRGGSAMDDTEGRCSHRRANPRRQSTYSDVGYRCCADALESAGAAR